MYNVSVLFAVNAASKQPRYVLEQRHRALTLENAIPEYSGHYSANIIVYRPQPNRQYSLPSLNIQPEECCDFGPIDWYNVSHCQNQPITRQALNTAHFDVIVTGLFRNLTNQQGKLNHLAFFS